MQSPTRITKNVEKRRLEKLRRRVERLEALMAKRRAEFVARKREYDAAGTHYWVMFARPSGVRLDVVTWAPSAEGAVESAVERYPDECGDPVAWPLLKSWPGTVNDPLTDDELVAVAKIAGD